MPFQIGFPEVIVLLIIALIVFGPKRLPELGKSMGKGIREFRSSLGGEDDDDDDDEARPRKLEQSKQPADAAEPVEGEVVTEKRA